MSLTVNANIAFLQRSLNSASQASDTAQRRMASGHRINSAKDDAAGLAIASRMETRMKGMQVAQRNASNAVDFASTADAALGQTNDLLTRMKELATQAANGTNGTSDMAQLDKEYQELALEVTRTLTGANYNGVAMLSTGAGAKDFMVGADSTDVITVTTTDMTANANVTAAVGGDLTSAANAKTAMDDLEDAIDDINTERSMYGAVSSRFTSAVAGLQSQADALGQSISNILDTDYSSEMATMQKNNVLQQAATSMLSQANQKPQSVMNLLRG